MGGVRYMDMVATTVLPWICLDLEHMGSDSTTLTTFQTQAIAAELEEVITGLPDHDPDDEAWKPLYQVGEGCGRCA